jgi:hypothetical protein
MIQLRALALLRGSAAIADHGLVQPVRIEVLGRACLAIRSGKHEIVTDPWFSGPALLGAWRPYPELTPPALAQLHERVDQATHVFISRERSDRFDPVFLSTLSPKVLVVAEHRNARFRAQLAQLVARGHSLLQLNENDALELDGRASVRVLCDPPRCGMQSLLLVHTPFGSVLVTDEHEIVPAALRVITERARVRVFAASLSFVAGSELPAALRASDPELRSKLDAARDHKVEHYRAALRALSPDLGLVLGGPVSFVDPVNAHLNAHPEALDWSAMVARLDRDSCVLWPAPASVFELGDEGVAPLDLLDFDSLLRKDPPSASSIGADAPAALPSDVEIDRAAAGFVTRVAGVLEGAGARCELPLYVSAVRDLDSLEGHELLFSLRIELDRERRNVARVDPVTPAPPFLHVITTPSLVHRWLVGEISYDELLQSGRARIAREPDVANLVLTSALRVAHDPDASAALIASLRPAAKSDAPRDRRPSDGPAR